MIRVDAAKCSGCRRCEVACSFFRTGGVGRGAARVKVAKLEECGIDYPVACRLCRERYCLRCPQKALQLGPQGQVIASPALCVLCGGCQERCPIGAIEICDDIVHVCDLCGGEPRCVGECTLGAITYAPGEDGKLSLAAFKRGSKGLGPEEKRVRYALESTRALREGWLGAEGE